MPFPRRKREPEPEADEAMRALPNDRWRNFVTWYLMEAPRRGAQTNACRKAGFGLKTKSDNHVQRYANRLMSDPRIQRAILKSAKKMLRGAAPEAVNALLNIIRDPAHRDHARGIGMLLDRTDEITTHASITHHVEIDHNSEALETLRQMKQWGAPRETLEQMFGYSGLSRYEAMLERDQPKRVAGPEQPKPVGPVIEGEVVKPEAGPKDPGLPGDRW